MKGKEEQTYLVAVRKGKKTGQEVFDVYTMSQLPSYVGNRIRENEKAIPSLKRDWPVQRIAKVQLKEVK